MVRRPDLVDGCWSRSRQLTVDNSTIWHALPGQRARALTRVPRSCLRRDPDVYWSDERPRCSPNGNWIAYVHEDDCHGEFIRRVKIMRADGSRRRTLIGFRDGTRFPFADGMHPSFSPDGRRLIFIGAGAQEGTARLWIVSAGSGKVIRKPQMPAASIVTDATYTAAEWGPDGRIALPLAPGRNPGRRVGVFAGVPGQPLERFRRLSRFSFRGALGGIDSGVDWSPFGDRMLVDRYLFCASSEDPSCPVDEEFGESDVYIVHTRGKLRRRRLTRGGFSGEPIFSPDGHAPGGGPGRPHRDPPVGRRPLDPCGTARLEPRLAAGDSWHSLPLAAAPWAV